MSSSFAMFGCLPGSVALNSSDTESADVKATSTATTATTAAASEVDENVPVNAADSCNKKSKRLPSFAAIFKRMNERDASAKRKNTEPDMGNNDNNEAATATATAGTGAGSGVRANEQLSPDVATDGNDNQPKVL